MQCEVVLFLMGLQPGKAGQGRGATIGQSRKTRRPVQAAEAALTTMEAKGRLLLESTVE